MKRIGIFAGTFDPVHKGHISFALQALQAAGLDEVAFVPESGPRRKTHVTHYSHRIAMIRLALAGHSNLKLLELPDKQFAVAKTLPRLQATYPDDKLFLLIGTDVLEHISIWPLTRRLLEQVGLVVAVRGQKDEQHAHKLISQLPVQPSETHVMVSLYKEVSSRNIRQALRDKQKPDGELAAILKYAREHWLYAPALTNQSSAVNNSK